MGSDLRLFLAGKVSQKKLIFLEIVEFLQVKYFTGSGIKMVLNKNLQCRFRSLEVLDLTHNDSYNSFKRRIFDTNERNKTYNLKEDQHKNSCRQRGPNKIGHLTTLLQ